MLEKVVTDPFNST